MAEDPSEDITVTQRTILMRGFGRRTCKLIEQEHAAPLVLALWKMQEPAFPSIKRCLDDECIDTRMRRILSRLVFERPTALAREP